MHVSARPLAALAAVLVLVLTGCGDGDDGGDTSGGGETDSTATQSPTQSPTPADDADGNDDASGNGSDDGSGGDNGAAGAVEVEIVIEDGQTTPAGERITVKPGQTIRLEVDSDTADELHLHSEAGQSFEVRPTDDQTFEFAIEQPGVYEMESHETGAQVISIQVQP